MRRVEASANALVVVAVLACGWAAGPALGQAPAPVPAAVRLGQGSVLWLEGGSNIHDWESRTTEPTLKVLRDAAAVDPADAAALDQWLRAGGLRGLELDVPLATLHSKKGATLDKNMRKALKGEQNPAITFRLTQARVGEASGDSIRVSADGMLSVAGRERPITVAGRLVRSEAGVWLNGSHGLRMSAFDVKPPTMMMGTLRVRDSVSVHFTLLLAPGAPSGTANSETRH